MKIYISGPMTGIKDNNYPEFHRAATLLRNKGYHVVNPAEIETEDKTWEGFMRADIKALMECNTVVRLDGWHESKGARLECMIAIQMGFKIFHISEFERSETA